MANYSFGFRQSFGYSGAYGYAGSLGLAQIMYQTNLGDFIYTTDGSGNTILDDYGSLGETYDGLLYSGRGIELGALNDVDIPIHHTLGSESLDTMAMRGGLYGTVDTITRTASIVLVGGSLNTYTPQLGIWDINEYVGKRVHIEYDITITSGTAYLANVAMPYNEAGDNQDNYIIYNETLTNGTNKKISIDVWGANSSTDLYGYALTFNGQIETDFTATVICSIKQITNPNSYLTYYDFTDGLVTVDNSLNTPSTKYTINTKTVNNFLTHTTAWSDTAWAKINNNPNLIGKLALETTGATKTIPELDMVMDAGASADKWFMCADRQSGTLTCARTATNTTISNWAATIETNADQNPKGIQTRAFTLDANGIPTSYTSNILNYFSTDYDNTQWNPSLDSAFWLEEIIDGVVYQHKYDGTNLTTYTDNVVGTPAPHSPENASYLLGKGVYPKVTADPYTSYQAKTFQLHNGIRYTNYDQTARYAILAAL